MLTPKLRHLLIALPTVKASCLPHSLTALEDEAHEVDRQYTVAIAHCQA